jgi:hypothetical protein
MHYSRRSTPICLAAVTVACMLASLLACSAKALAHAGPPAPPTDEVHAAGPPVSEVVNSAHLRGTALTVRLRCGHSGRISLRERGRMVSAARLDCRGGRARAQLTLSHPVLRRTHSRVVTMLLSTRAAGRRSNTPLSIGPSKHAHRHARRPTTHASTWPDTGWPGVSANCQRDGVLGNGGSVTIGVDYGFFGAYQGEQVAVQGYIQPYYYTASGWVKGAPILGDWSYYNTTGRGSLIGNSLWLYNGYASSFYVLWKGQTVRHIPSYTYTYAALTVWTQRTGYLRDWVVTRSSGPAIGGSPQWCYFG